MRRYACQQSFVDRGRPAKATETDEVARLGSAVLGDGGGVSVPTAGSVTTQCANTQTGAGRCPTRCHGVPVFAPSGRSSSALRASQGESQPRTRRSAATQRTSAEQRCERESSRPPATNSVPFSTAQPKNDRPTRNLFRRSHRICGNRKQQRWKCPHKA